MPLSNTLHKAMQCVRHALAHAAGGVLAAALLAIPSAPREARAETFYGINDSTIYSVDIATGGPATPLTNVPAFTNSSYVTLATRPSDGMLFFLDSQNANPTLRSWDPTNPAVAPQVRGTVGIGVAGVIRLGFDASDNLYAANGGAIGTGVSIWRLNPANGAILDTIQQSGAATTDSSGDLCLQPGTGTLYTVAGTSLFTTDVNTGINTLLGTFPGLPGNATGCAFDSTGRLVVAQINTAQLYAVNLTTLAITALPASAGTILLDLATGPTRAADLSLTKTATNITAANTVSFTITVTNSGPARATDVRVLDALPAGLTFSSATASQGTYSTAAIGTAGNLGFVPAATWRVGVLNVGGTATLTVNATVAAGTSAATNTTQVSYVDQKDPDSIPNNNNAAEDDQASVTINRSPDLQVVKSTPLSFAVGLAGTYTITVNNTAGSAATSGSYTVTDPMPGGLTIAGTPAGTGWNCAASTATQLSCSSTTVIAAGAANPNAITANVAVAAAAAPSVSNTVTVVGGGEINTANFTGNNSNTLVTAVCTTNCPDLRPNKALSTPSTTSLTVGTNSTYTLSVTNVGGLTTSGAYTLVDTMPTGLTIVGTPTGTNWTCTASTAAQLSCTSSTALTSNATSAPITLTVSVANTAVPSVTNTATVSGGGDPNPGNNTVSVTSTVIDFDLTITKTTASTFTFGGTNPTYTLTVGNIGGRATTNSSVITVTDTLPTGLSFVSGTGTGWTACTATGQVVTCVRPAANTIAANASAPAITLTVSINNQVGATVTNNASVSKPDEAPANTGNNTSGDVTSTVSATDLQVSKTHTGNFSVGVNDTYTITAFNIGGRASTGTITLTDTLPAGMTYVSATGTGWTCSAAPTNPFTCTSTTAIAAGAPGNPITLTITPTAAGTRVNNVSIAGGNEPAGNTGNNTAADSTAVFVTPTITKAFSPTSVQAGVTTTLTLTVTNPATNTVSLAGISFIDAFPSGMTVAATPAFSNTCNGTVVSGSAQGDTVVSLNSSGTVAPGATCQVKVNVVSITVGTNANTVSEVSTTNSGTSNTTTASRTANLTVTAPGNAVLTKISNPNPIGVNQVSVLTFTIVNKTTASANLGFDDVFPSGVVYRSRPAGGTCTGSGTPAFSVTDQTGATLVAGTSTGIRVRGVDLAASASCTILVGVSAATAGSYANTAANIANLQNGLTANANDTLVVGGTTLTKAFSPTSVPIGQTSDLTFTLTNDPGSPPQGGLAFTETLPANLVVAAAPATTQCSGTVTAAVGGSTISLANGALASGTASCPVTVSVRSSVNGTFNNTAANLSGLSTGMTNSVNATLTVTTGVAMSITKAVQTLCDPKNFSVNPKAIPGAYMQYTVTVANAPGSVNSATLTTITDALDPKMAIDPDFRTGTSTACAASPPGSATGSGFRLTCVGGSRSCNTPVYFTTASDAASDAIGISGQIITATFGDAASVTKALPTEPGYAAGELKAGESVIIQFNTIVQ